MIDRIHLGEGLLYVITPRVSISIAVDAHDISCFVWIVLTPSIIPNVVQRVVMNFILKLKEFLLPVVMLRITGHPGGIGVCLGLLFEFTPSS